MFFRSPKKRIQFELSDAIQSFTDLGAVIQYNKRKDLYYITYDGQRYTKTAAELEAFNKKVKDERSGDLENLNI